MKKVEETAYAYPCSIIKAHESKLLTKADLQKLLDAKTVNQAMSILADFGYGDGKELANPRDFEKCISNALGEAYLLIHSIVPAEVRDLLDIFLYPNDYFNLKVILKAEALNIDPSDLLTSGGSIENDKLLEIMRERNYVLMSSTMRDAVINVRELFAKSNDPQLIDILLDKACSEDMLEKAMEYGNEFVINCVKLSLDIINVSTFIRLREMNKPSSFYQKVFLPGGSVSEKILVDAWEDTYSQVADKLEPFGFKNLVTEGAVQSLNGKYVRLEKAGDNMLLKYIKDAKYVSFGIEPLVGYVQAKNIEATNIRLILTGKIANIPNEITEERLRDTYV